MAIHTSEHIVLGETKASFIEFEYIYHCTRLIEIFVSIRRLLACLNLNYTDVTHTL